MILLDLNVLIYAVNEQSMHHRVSKEWLEKTVTDRTEEIGVAWVVYCGFLRLSTSRRVFENPLSVADALMWIDDLLDQPSVSMVDPGRGHRGFLRHLLLTVGTGGNLTTDAHLAALCLENDAKLATGDRDFLRFAGLRTLFLY